MSKTYKIFLSDLHLQATIGVTPIERTAPQPITAHVELLASLPDNLNDDYEKVICYKELTEKIESLTATEQPQLLETLAEKIAAVCLQEELALSVTVRLDKPQALDGKAIPAVEIHMENPL